MEMSTVVRLAAPEDVDAIDKMNRQAGDVFGFVPKVVLASSLVTHELMVACNGTSVDGAMRFHHRLDKVTTLYEVVVREERRGNSIGRLLLSTLIKRATDKGHHTLRAKCPNGIAANDFYKALGWECVGLEQGRVRPLLVWSCSLATNQLPLW